VIGGCAPRSASYRSHAGDLADLISESRRAGMRVALRSEVSSDILPDRLGRTRTGSSRRDSPMPAITRRTAEVSVCCPGRPSRPDDGAGQPGSPRARCRCRAPARAHGLAERAMLAGGYLARQRAGSGEWRLWAWLPWPHERAREPPPVKGGHRGRRRAAARRADHDAGRAAELRIVAERRTAARCCPWSGSTARTWC